MGTKQVPLIACPSEIISQIAGHLDNPSLSRLALSSRALNVIATPYLYNHINPLSYSHPCLPPASIDCWNLTVLLLERPHLAGYVRHFSMRKAYSDDRRREQGKMAPPSQAILTAIATASHSKEEERQWLEDLSFTKSTHEDALMALLLPTLPNLKTLDLTLEKNVKYFSRMMQRASRKEKPFDTAPAFEKLSDIMYTQDHHLDQFCHRGGLDDERHDEEAEAEEDPCHNVMPLSLPAVSRIFGQQSEFQLGIPNRGPWVLPLACGFSPQLSHLELRDCLLASQVVVDLLQVPVALKTFVYEVTPATPPHTPNSSILNVNIYKAMEYQMKSLENIWLDCVPWDEELVEFSQFDDARPMPSFANFKNLRVLRIASPFLFGSIQRLRQEGKGYADLLVSLLPERLRILHITRCDHHVRLIEIPLEFLLLRLPNATHLRKIIIEHPISGMLGRCPRINRLVELAKSKNISLIAGKAGSEHLADDCYDWKGLSIDRWRLWTSTERGRNHRCPEGYSYAEQQRRKRCARDVQLLSVHAMSALSPQ